MTIFFKDVTDIKEITLALKNNEEKYRSLIEQASDGIVITDMEGTILEVNNSIKQMIGFDKEEMIGYHIKEYLPEDDIEMIPLRINELMKGKSLLYERRLLKRDGTAIDVEVNSKMASTHTLIAFIRNITERKAIKKQILKEKELSDKIINSLPGIFYLYNKEGRFLRWNKNFETVTGYNADEIKKLHPLDLYNEKYKPLLSAKIASVFVAGYDNVEAGFLLKNKTEIPYYFTGQSIEYEGQACLMGVGLDFSEKEKSENTIKASEEKFRTIIEQASDGIFIADEQTYLVDVNSAGCRMSGYTLEELKKLRFMDVVPPEDPATDPLMITVMKKGESVINERRLIRKDGSNIDVEISAKKLADGRYQSFVRDITERKKADEMLQQSEKKYKLLFYNNPLPMWMVTIPDLDFIDVNEAAIKQYGYSKEEFLKLNARNIRPDEDLAYFLNEVEKAQTDKINVRNWRHKRKDGTIIQVENISHEIIYEGKRVWLSLSHDVTEKYVAKELLQKSYEDIRQLAFNLQTIREDERTNIAREIHDELGQQLTGFKMDLHWLMRRIKSTDDEVNNKMKQSIELINAMIASVRKISTDLRPSILDDLGLLPALEWQSEEFEKRSGTKVIFISKVDDIIIQPVVATGIFRIYQELLTNIARHANATQITAMLDKDKERLYFSVTDNGVGFDLETINNKKTLGLLGIKERTLLFGGTYEFKSEPGEGSVTNISIPLQQTKPKT